MKSYLQLHGAVVAAVDFGVDAGSYEAVLQPGGAEPVVDAPAGVLLAGMEAVGPPGVDVGLVGVEVAEGVDEASLEQLGELRALLVGEPGVLVVRLRILQVYLLVRHVHVAADKDGLAAVEHGEGEAEGIVPRHAARQAAQAVLRVRRIDGDDVEVPVLKRDDPALGVHLPQALVGRHLGDDVGGQSVGDAERTVAGVDGCAAVALLVGIAPVGFVAGELKVELSLLHLRLLQTEEIRVERGKAFAEAFAAHGAESVYIPGNEFHICGV